MTLQKREAGIDLVRCLGLLFVTGLHAFLYNGFYSETQGLNMWAANSFRWLFSGCNGLFMLLTGYLKTRKPLGKAYFRGLWTVLAGYGLVCAVSFPIRYSLMGEKDGWFIWLERMVTFEGYAWYIEMYIGLILLSPFINLALDQLKGKRELLCAAGVMVLLTALPSLTPLRLLPDYWTGLYPLTYYTIGAVSTAALMGLLSSLTAAGGVFTDGFAQGGFGGCLTTLLVTLVFLGTYRLPVPWALHRPLAWLAGGVFEGYLLSRLLDVWVYDLVPGWHSPECYPLLFLCVTVPVFLISAVCGRALHSLAVRLTAK